MAQATLATIELSAVPAIGQTRLFINNEWVDSLDGKDILFYIKQLYLTPIHFVDYTPPHRR